MASWIYAFCYILLLGTPLRWREHENTPFKKNLTPFDAFLGGDGGGDFGLVIQAFDYTAL